MKRTHLLSSLTLACLCSSLNARPVEAKHAKSSEAPAESAKSPAAARASSPDVDTKVVPYGQRDIVRVKTKLRFSTLIVLPKNEEILDFVCGDKEYWAINGVQNFAHVKPARAGSETNLTLITASGNIYSFVLMEVSEVPGAAADLNVFIEPKEDAMISAASGRPRFVSAQVADDYRQQAEIAKAETRQTKQAAQAAIDSGVSKFISNVRFPYRYEAGKKPFFVRCMYHDDKMTYIQARPEETPTLYEIKDGQPNVVNFEYQNGVYVVGKILDQGYLTIGKQKLGFKREE
jgi:type IV secretory pathway VirB9-like protein